MFLKISPLDLRNRLGDILNRVSLRHDQYLVVRKGKPLAAVVPIEKLEWLEWAARQQILDVMGRQSGALEQQEADSLANEAKHDTRMGRE